MLLVFTLLSLKASGTHQPMHFAQQCHGTCSPEIQQSTANSVAWTAGLDSIVLILQLPNTTPKPENRFLNECKVLWVLSSTVICIRFISMLLKFIHFSKHTPSQNGRLVIGSGSVEAPTLAPY